MNILVTGGEGQLGKSIRANLPADCHNRYIFAGSTVLDITNPDSIGQFLDRENIGVVVNCAAYTAVDKAEDEPEKAEMINGRAVGFLAEAIKKRNGFLIHLSTDYVYGGDTSCSVPIKEEVAPNPVSVYGRTKLDGEKKVEKSGVDAIVLRTAWLYSEYGKNFMKTMLNLLAEKEEIKVVNDQRGTPTYAGNLAKAIISIIETDKLRGYDGIYNFTDEGEATWFDFAKAISRHSGKTGCRILPCSTDEYPAKAVRPAYSVLDKSKFKNRFSIEIPEWEDSLKSILKK